MTKSNIYVILITEKLKDIDFNIIPTVCAQQPTSFITYLNVLLSIQESKI